MYAKRLFLPLLLLILALVQLAATPASEAARSRGKKGRAPGSISGRIDTRSGPMSGGLTFLLDGARVRPRFTQGGFVIKNVRAGEHTLSVVQRGSNLGAHRDVDVRPNQTARVGILELVPGGQITGLVSRVDEDAGSPTPLAGVEVVAVREDGDGMPPPDGEGEGERFVALTDDSGAYSFRAMPPGSYAISVVVPGLSAGMEWVWVEAGRTAVADFLLEEVIEPGVGTLSGTVTDPTGAPVEGALVSVFSDQVFVPARGPDSPGGSKSPPDWGSGQFSTLTDEEGHYRLSVPSGRLTLTVFADGFEPFEKRLRLLKRQRLTQDVSLQEEVPPPPGALFGQVLDAWTGEPISGVEITFRADGGWEHDGMPRHPNGGGDVITVTSDGDGRYEIPEIASGEYHVTLSHRHYGFQETWIWVPEGEKLQFDFWLEDPRDWER